jgi:hypothetical protein
MNGHCIKQRFIGLKPVDHIHGPAEKYTVTSSPKGKLGQKSFEWYLCSDCLQEYKKLEWSCEPVNKCQHQSSNCWGRLATCLDCGHEWIREDYD